MAITMAKRIEQFKKRLPPSETIANMERDEMIKVRLQATNQKNPKKRAEIIQKYFRNNETMPGEGALKAVTECVLDRENPSAADAIYRAMGNGDIKAGRLKTEKKMARDYAVTCIKQFKPDNVNFDVLLSEHHSRKELGTGMSRILCTAQGSKIMTAGAEPEDRRPVADIDPKFLTNHRATDGMPISLVMVDNGNGPNGMLVRAIIDLGDEPLDWAPDKWNERDLEHDNRRPPEPSAPKPKLKNPDPDDPAKGINMIPDDSDDFTKAVNMIPIPDDGLQI